MNRLFLSLCLGLAGGALLASSCGPTRPPCTATTCTGCCDTTGECRTGLDNSACGSRGAMCAQCGLVSTCVSGACALNNNTGAGTAGGFSGTGGGAGGGSVGGGSVAGGVGGGTGGGVARCNASTCAGCCTGVGQCVSGLTVQECGTNGTTCIACTVGQSCSSGRCSNGTGGGAAGGGAAGGSAGGSGSCNATSCPTGCCQGGTCQPPTAAQCGRNGTTCMRCNTGQTCVNGTCTACTGCIDVGSGLCVTGNSNTACGRNGAVCGNCGTGTCSSGMCVGSCTPSSCPSGCCDGANCVQPASQFDGQCGRGPSAGGQSCRACTGGQVCDTVAGDCVTGGGGLDGGLPPFPDGGIGSICFTGSQCAVGECCFSIMGLGVCATIGNPNLLGGTTCGLSQMSCSPTTCMTPQTCNTSLGICL